MSTEARKFIGFSLLGIFSALVVKNWLDNNAAGEDENAPPETLLDTAWSLIGSMNMRTVDKNLINHPQIQAFLRVIRRGEGTADPTGYYRLFGGGTFTDTSWHPNVRVPFRNTYSTAAGAYQFLYRTWIETAKAMELPDFSPLSQDLGALGRLAYRNAIDDIVAGNFEAAILKTAKEWASLPGSPYGQPTISMQTALNTFIGSGGQVA